MKISARIENENLILEVWDSGAGIGEKEFQNGVGLSNIERRLRTYYGEKAGLEIKSENGTEAKIKLPLTGAKARV